MRDEEVKDETTCPLPSRECQYATLDVERSGTNVLVLNDEVFGCEQLSKSAFDFKVDGHMMNRLMDISYQQKSPPKEAVDSLWSDYDAVLVFNVIDGGEVFHDSVNVWSLVNDTTSRHVGATPTSHKVLNTFR